MFMQSAGNKVFLLLFLQKKNNLLFLKKKEAKKLLFLALPDVCVQVIGNGAADRSRHVGTQQEPKKSLFFF
jgi:hypothetical protein